MPASSSELLYCALLALVCGERLVELGLSRRNLRRALARGGLEVGQGHFRVMAALHLAFLAACAAETVGLHRPFAWALAAPMLALAVAAQLLRYWAISTLGERWNTRIVIVPGAPPVVGGPYRYVRHPNYVAVVIELFALPLIHGAWWTAVVFSVANAALLTVRIRAEEQALGAAYQQAFAGRPRFVPGRTGDR